jgi:hypothetical protein
MNSAASGSATYGNEKRKVLDITLRKQVLNSFTLVMDLMPGNVHQKASNSSPGRFFAVNELKLMLAFILLRYDVMIKDGKRPEATKFMNVVLPDMKAEILFKKRVI